MTRRGSGGDETAPRGGWTAERAIASARAHRNKYTGEVIAATQGFCPTCHLAFNSDDAYDTHRPRAFESGPCLDPASVGMRAVVGTWGAVVWDNGPRPETVNAAQTAAKRAERTHTRTATGTVPYPDNPPTVGA